MVDVFFYLALFVFCLIGSGRTIYKTYSVGLPIDRVVAFLICCFYLYGVLLPSESVSKPIGNGVVVCLFLA